MIELLSYIKYEPSLDKWFWKKKPSKKTLVGSEAGSTNESGYRSVCLNKKNYLLHRVTWFWYYGEVPHQIDHLDGDPSNNKIDNLRIASHMINMQNKRKAMSNSETGFLGVHYRKDRGIYYACINYNKQYKYLGSRNTPEEAYKLYLNAKQKLHEGNTL